MADGARLPTRRAQPAPTSGYTGNRAAFDADTGGGFAPTVSEHLNLPPNRKIARDRGGAENDSNLARSTPSLTQFAVHPSCGRQASALGESQGT